MAFRLILQEPARSQFSIAFRQAYIAGNFARFLDAHNRIVRSLKDVEQAKSAGEILYKTQKSGGEVRLICHDGIAVTYVVLPIENVAFVLRYFAEPLRWTSS